jgi:hypothetical protein
MSYNKGTITNDYSTTDVNIITDINDAVADQIDVFQAESIQTYVDAAIAAADVDTTTDITAINARLLLIEQFIQNTTIS